MFKGGASIIFLDSWEQKSCPGWAASEERMYKFRKMDTLHTERCLGAIREGPGLLDIMVAMLRELAQQTVTTAGSLSFSGA